MVIIGKNINLLLLITSFVGILSFIHANELYSVGSLTIVKHSEKQAINKTITLNTLSYYEHLSNLEMLHVRVVKGVPFDGCSIMDTKTIFPENNKTYPDTLLLIDGLKGGCNYWKKAQNAKQALVKGVIIVNDDPEKNGNRPADFSDDGLFLSFLIKPKDALLIFPLQTSQFQGVLSIKYIQRPSEKSRVVLWLSSLNRQSYEYLQWWNKTLTNLPQLETKIQWEPKYVLYGKTTDQNRHVYSCMCNGLFCSPQYHGKTADALIKEDLRQKLIHKNYPEKYLRYIYLFTDRCLENYLSEKYTEQCSQTQMVNAQIDVSKIINQIDEFSKKCDEDQQLFGELLTDKGRFSMIGSYPIIVLNRQILQINNQNQLQAAICRKLSLEDSEGCIQNYRTTTNQIVISVVFFVLILIGLFGVGFLIVMCYKNKLRKEMQKQVKMQVSTAVQHYFQLSEETSKHN